MANPHRGEVELKAGEKTYTLRFSVNALCELEEALGESVNEIAQQVTQSPRITTVRKLVWAALRDHHPEVSEHDAGEIMSEVGVPAILEKVGAAFSLAFPAQEGARESVDGSRPRKAGGGLKSSPAMLHPA